MLTQQQLSELMREVPAKEIAKLAGVNVKTVYRMRWQSNKPNLATIEKLVLAATALKAQRQAA